MKTIKQSTFLCCLLFLFSVMTVSTAQSFRLDSSNSTLQVDGTSNLHDWDVKATNQNGKLVVEMDNQTITAINDLEFTVNAESLKSGKSGMDKNMYKALNTDRHKQIRFKQNRVKTLDCSTSGDCKVVVSGSLTISGTTKPMDVSFTLKNSGSKITVNGTKKIKMTDFGIDPPKAVFGTITTGNEVEVKFNSSFVK